MHSTHPAAKKEPRGLRLRPRRWLAPALSALLGLLFSGARTARGLMPFGAAYLAAAGHPLPAAAGAFAGYIAGGGRDGLIYAAAVAVILSCRMVLEGTRLGRRRWFFPLCAAVALGCTKGVVTRSVRELALLGCELLLCMGLALVLRESREKSSPLRFWGRMAAALGLMLSLLPLRVLTFAPARSAGAFLALTAGTFGGSGAGAAVGAALGASVDLAEGGGPFFALSWCLSALLAGMLGRRERLPAALSFCAGAGAVSLWQMGNAAALPACLESLLAALVLVSLPQRAALGLDNAFSPLSLRRAIRTPGESAQPLAHLSRAVSRLGTAMDALWAGAAPADPSDLSAVWRTAGERACRGCKNKELCWQRDYPALRDLLTHLSAPLRETHSVSKSDLPGWFLSRCPQSERFCGAINDAWRESLRRRARQSQTDQARALMRRQYESLGSLLDDCALRAGRGTEYDPILESRLRRVVRAYLPGAKTAVCVTGGRLQIDLDVPAGAGDYDPTALIRSLENALGRELMPPASVPSARGTLLRIRQKEGLALAWACAARSKGEGPVSGDSFRAFHTGDGRFILLLSDGMGTGDAAGALSRRALELVESFVAAGCSLCESTGAVLPVLAARFPQWGFVTLDLCEIDLFTGQAGFLKYGAAPGLVLREGKCIRLDCRTLPAGLEPLESPVPLQHLRLKAGDRLILLTDGVWDERRTPALAEKAAELPLQDLADLLLHDARSRGGEDDMTVLAADLSLPGASFSQNGG